MRNGKFMMDMQMRKYKAVHQRKARIETQPEREATMQAEWKRLAKLAETEAAEAEACKQLANGATNEAITD
ncbi:GH11761 [Drosophila grimshawi]|uniref:GH11761 n=1 Tax=Drosophila grimshawi TaxID=7222 RepID=B4K096_DROGR|nr:GH11761 [Drosophila grimshawi]